MSEVLYRTSSGFVWLSWDDVFNSKAPNKTILSLPSLAYSAIQYPVKIFKILLFIPKQKFTLSLMWDSEKVAKVCWPLARFILVRPKVYIYVTSLSEWSCHIEAILTSDWQWWIKQKQQQNCNHMRRHDWVVFLQAAPLLAIFNQAITLRGIFSVSLKWSCYICLLPPTHVLSAVIEGVTSVSLGVGKK